MLGNTVQMELVVVAEELSSRAVARVTPKEKLENQRGAKSGAHIILRSQEETDVQKEVRGMGNAAEFRAEILPEEELPKLGYKLLAKPLRLRRCCLWQLEK